MITLTEWGVMVSTYVELRANASLLAGAQLEHLQVPVRMISMIEYSVKEGG